MLRSPRFIDTAKPHSHNDNNTFLKYIGNYDLKRDCITYDAIECLQKLKFRN